jgi:hypothetical protein
MKKINLLVVTCLLLTLIVGCGKQEKEGKQIAIDEWKHYIVKFDGKDFKLPFPLKDVLALGYKTDMKHIKSEIDELNGGFEVLSKDDERIHIDVIYDTVNTNDYVVQGIKIDQKDQIGDHIQIPFKFNVGDTYSDNLVGKSNFSFEDNGSPGSSGKPYMVYTFVDEGQFASKDDKEILEDDILKQMGKITDYGTLMVKTKKKDKKITEIFLLNYMAKTTNEWSNLQQFK